jgi:hypothetical protein
VSRAFVKEDGPDGPPPVYSLPARDDAAFPLAAAQVLLTGADRGDTAGAESATGYYWGDPALGDPMHQLLLEAEDRGDDRMAQLARRYLRRAGLNPEG